MKRIIGVFGLFMLYSCTAHAGIFDVVKGWAGSFSWTAVGYVVTGLLGIGILAKKREWVSVVLLVVANLGIGVFEILKVAGLSLADGKVEGDELKAIWEEMTDIPTLWKEVVTVFKGKVNG